MGQAQTEEVVQSLLGKWGTVLKLVRRAGNRSGGLRRVVVKVVDVLKPASLVPHKGAPPSSLDAQSRGSMKGVHAGGGFVLCDIVPVRLASDHRSFRGMLVPAGGADPDVYQDDLSKATRPAQAVYRNGEVIKSSYISCGTYVHALRERFSMDDLLTLLYFLSSLTNGDEDECSDDNTLDADGAGDRASSSGRSNASGAGADATGAPKVMCTVPHRSAFNVVLLLLDSRISCCTKFCLVRDR